MEVELDMELFIDEVKEPCGSVEYIYRRIYHDKVKKQNARIEICRKLNPLFEKLQEKEKKDYGNC